MSQTLCPHCHDVATALVKGGEQVEANTLHFALAAIMKARAEGITIDALVEGLLDLDRVLPGAELGVAKMPKPRPHRRRDVRHEAWLARGESNV